MFVVVIAVYQRDERDFSFTGRLDTGLQCFLFITRYITTNAFFKPSAWLSKYSQWRRIAEQVLSRSNVWTCVAHVLLAWIISFVRVCWMWRKRWFIVIAYMYARRKIFRWLVAHLIKHHLIGNINIILIFLYENHTSNIVQCICSKWLPFWVFLDSDVITS